MVTLGKAGTLHDRRLVSARLHQDEDAVKALFNEIAPTQKERRGGYTRIVRLGQRNGDAAQMVILEFVDVPMPEAEAAPETAAAAPATNAAAAADGKAADAAAPAAGVDGKAKDEKAGDHLNLKVKSQDGNEIYFKVKKTTQFRKVMIAYCRKVGADVDAVRFLFDGTRIRPDQTPAELEMEDEDEIDAMVSQTGGF